MSIQRKFGILLGLICLSVIVSLGASLWAVTIFQRELSDPFSATASVLEKLDDLKKALESSADALEARANQDSAETRSTLRSLAENLKLGAATITNDEEYIRRIGVGASRTLADRLRRVATLLQASSSAANFDVSLTQAMLIDDIALINRISNRALADAQLAVTHGADIRQQLIVVMSLSFLLAIMTCVLGLILVRRWILRPIAELRAAAVRIGAGDYGHRITVSGRDEFAQLSSEVNDMAGLIAEMQEERVEKERLAAAGEVIRRLAHNIRNPLSGIRGLAEVARAELPPDSDLAATQNRIISTVDKFERWLAEMLNSTSPLRLEPTRQEVAPWIAGIVDSHRAMAQTREVELVLDTSKAPRTATFDARHLEQAIVAILSNAIEVSPKGSKVSIVTELDDENDTWRIRISDEGPGVPRELAEKVFGANFTTKPDGHGIGLAVAQQVVRGHNGRIFVDTASRVREGEGVATGATFVALLPVEAPTVEPADVSGEHLNGVTSGENSHHRG